ncbi:MAG: hypothetical protein VYD54_13205 [Bdellovibrionota bacterium]|nr:hypothetical protein [Bdellovibrionota bacterium]
MIELLKIYSKKYLKDSLYLNLCVLLLVFLTAYVNPKIDRNEVSLTYFFSLNIILFFFSYPMEECLKWVLVTTIKKYKIIIFNILFQLYKIALSLFFLFLNLLFFGLPEKIEEKKSSFQEGYFFSTGLENILDSRFFFGIIIFSFFIIVTIFSPSPKLILAQPGFLRLKWADTLYYLKKYKYFCIFLILLLPGVKLLKNYWNSPIVIYSLGFTYLIFNFFHSYFKKLKYTFVKKKTYYLIVIFILIFSFINLKIYSDQRLKKRDLTSDHMASEILFQRSFYQKSITPNLDRILLGDLSFSNFKKLLNYLKEERSLDKKDITYLINKHPISEFLKKKDDLLWSFYLFKKKVFPFKEKNQFSSLKQYFFNAVEGHSYQYGLIKNFAKLTS